jgi:hypothetical protein
MNTPGKWLTRTGSLLLLLGFFLPSVAVSCGGTNIKQSFSLATLASQNNSAGLYLVLIGAVGALALTFVLLNDRSRNILVIGGQIASLGIGALILVITLFSLYNQVNNASSLGGLLQNSGVSLFTYSVEFGFFVLLLGYILGGVGAVMQFMEGGKSVLPHSPPIGMAPMRETPDAFAAPPYAASAYTVPARPVESARLEVVSGSLMHTVTPLRDNFLIGRSSDCNLTIPDGQISRHHVCLRLAQGIWFIQDQGSTLGTFVNGQRVQATRLNPGDEITLGSTVLVFRM